MNLNLSDIQMPTENLTTAEKATLGGRLDRAIFVFTAAAIFVFPLLFIPALSSWFDLPKTTLLIAAAGIAAVLWLFKAALGKKITLIRSPFDAPVLVFVAVSFVSAYFSANRVMSLVSDPLLYLGGFVLFLVIANTINKERGFLGIIRVFLGTVAILSLISFLQMAAMLINTQVKNPALNLVIFSPTFSATGSFVTQMMLTVVALPLALGLYLKNKKVLDGVILGALVLGLMVGILTLYKNPPALLSIETGWKIATGVLGSSINAAIFGIGPGNYADAFSIFKPIEFNSTTFWTLRFTNGANFYFYLLTTIGVAGLAAFLWLVTKLFQVAQKRLELPTTGALEKGLIGSLAVILVMYFFVPGPAVITLALFVLLGLLVAHFNIAQNQALASPRTLNLPENAWLDFVPSLLVAGLTLYALVNLFRMITADYFFAQSLAAAAKNQGTQTYNAQIKAINLFPENDTYKGFLRKMCE